MVVKVNKPLFKEKQGRVWEIDYFRGALVITMIFGHFIYDILTFCSLWYGKGEIYKQLYVAANTFWSGSLIELVRSIIVFSFFFISGISTSFSKSNFMRGLKVLFFAVLIAGISAVVNIDIQFGVLHALSVSMLIYAILRMINKSEIPLAIFSATLIFTGIILIQTGYVHQATKGLYHGLPGIGNHADFLVNILGVPMELYDDFYPLLPWAGCFLLGTIFGRTFYHERQSLMPSVCRPVFEPVIFLGKHAFVIYLLHQIVLYGLFVGFAYIIRLPLPF